MADISKFVEKYGQMYSVTEADFKKPKITQADRTEAQAIWTALVTDTLLPEETEEESDV